MKKKWRSKQFRMIFDDCETEILRLLYENDLTFRDLSKHTGVGARYIAMLAYGYLSPVYIDKKRAGKIKPSAQKICDFFFMDISEIFPRYFCNISNKRMLEAIDIEPYETYSEYVSGEKPLHISDISGIIKKSLLCLSLRELGVLKKSISGMSLDEIGEIHKVSRARITQIRSKALRKLKPRLECIREYAI